MATSPSNIEIWFKIEKDADGYPETRDWEGLWCDVMQDGYRVKSVPFFVKDVAPEDIISASKSDEGVLEFAKVIKRGGYSVYRLLVYAADDVSRVIDELKQLGARVEADDKLIAIAASVTLDEVFEYIERGRLSGRWGAQDGFIFEDNS